MPATSTSQRRLFAIAAHHPDQLNAANKGLADLPQKTLHDFAATPEKGLPRRKMYGEDGGHWMEGAVKHPGALTAEANAAGMTPMSFARKHYNDGGKVGERSRFAVNAQR